MTLLLKPAELLYRSINRVRRALYRRRILRPKRLRSPVISIGNITAGGAGKTPAVIAVCRELARRGLRVAVLTRGYGRDDVSDAGLVTSNDTGKYGDEPVLIKQHTNADVIVGPHRYENAVEYLRDHQCDVFVLDDGFQHLQLHRDLDVVIDAPGRFHREGRAALADADVIIPRRMRLSVPPELEGRTVFAFAGLADNRQFFESLRAAGLDVAATRSFRDHHRYTPEDLERLKRDAAGAPLVTTEKDAVKIDDPAVTAIAAELEIDQSVLDVIAAAATEPPRKKRRRKGWLVQRVEYAMYRAVSRFVASLSEEAVYRWGSRFGNLLRITLRRRDALAMHNLRASFPERDRRELRHILDECWRHFGREGLLYLKVRELSLEELADRCPFENAHLVEESIARGKGTILVSAHWGGWEIGGLAIMSLVGNVRTVARPLDNELLERDLAIRRRQTGAVVVDRRRAARVLTRGLAENAVAVLLIDQAVLPREGVLVPFLGRPAWTTPAPAKLAVRAGSTIVFAFCKPDGLRHRLEFESPIRTDLLEESERDPVELTRRINDVISRRIRERPELWLWMHDRWKGTGEREWRVKRS